MIAHVPGGTLTASAASGIALSAATLVVLRMGASPRQRRRAAATALGLVTVAVAVSAPVDAVAERTFSAHMAQHLALMVVAPALLAGGRAGATLIATLEGAGLGPPRRWKVRGLRSLAARRGTAVLVAAAVFHAVILTVWHLPAVFEAAIDQPLVHAVEHATMFTAGLALFWSWTATARSRPLPAFAATFATAVHGAAVGALITFASAPVFAAGDGSTTLADQQLAGLLMWIPTGAVYTAVAVAGVWRAAAVADRRAPPMGVARSA